jgi:regulator of RNase E activity RraA
MESIKSILSDAERFAWIRQHLYVPVVCDSLDAMGYRDQAMHSTDHAGTNALWGELMSTVALRNGSVGCICDSMIRDCKGGSENNFRI